MIRTRTLLALVASACTLGGTSLQAQAQDLSGYREFKLGSTLASIETISGGTRDDVKLIQQRPATIQELRWRPQPRFSAAMAQTEAVREVILSFYNDRLYQIDVDYDRQRTEGLTDADLIESISTRYGVPVLRAAAPRTPLLVAEADGDAVVARWSDTEASVTLVRGTYPTSLRLVVALKAVDAHARVASEEAIRKDYKEVSQREADPLVQQTAGARIAGEKARVVNKPLFKP